MPARPTNRPTDRQTDRPGHRSINEVKQKGINNQFFRFKILTTQYLDCIFVAELFSNSFHSCLSAILLFGKKSAWSCSMIRIYLSFVGTCLFLLTLRTVWVSMVGAGWRLGLLRNAALPVNTWKKNIIKILSHPEKKRTMMWHSRVKDWWKRLIVQK